MFDYVLSLLVLGIIGMILIIHLFFSRDYLLERRILERASKADIVRYNHLRVARKLSELKTKKTKLSKHASGEADLDKLVMTLLGYGGIFRFVLTKKVFSPRELVVELGLTMDTIRKWINNASEMEMIEKTRSVHGVLLYQLNKRVVADHLDLLRNSIIDFVEIRAEGARGEISLEEAFNTIREALAIIMPLKENLRQLINTRFNISDLERLGISGPALNRWLDDAERLNIIRRESENAYVLNSDNLRDFLQRFNLSMSKILQYISK